jgi:hypothetical protein
MRLLFGMIQANVIDNMKCTLVCFAADKVYIGVLQAD